ncbi:SMI1 / KNR4 family protein [Aquisphaera giovannonii]|uniref:SMI1 / KNR4 family protein n=1 Tax=Aquisphaera giovannonii TaxID=406548 RepID=A0A5B9W2T3_9BACT|nr:SMI1/KNR4 family protein [Aquisphaera giovannonii]QEH34916.1 SMI1 / KNR4 family protein [Aquisphaera giovannonii]
METADRWSDFLDASGDCTGPPLTDAMVASAERALGYALPASYLRLLRVRNGGRPRRRCFPTDDRWPDGHLRIEALFGIGYPWGIDSDEFGSRHLIRQAGFPEVGIVVALTPTAGHDAFMLDYRDCGPRGEPRVVFVDPEDDLCEILAPDFETFLGGLVDCRPYDEASARAMEEFRRRARPG